MWRGCTPRDTIASIVHSVDSAKSAFNVCTTGNIGPIAGNVLCKQAFLLCVNTSENLQ